MMRIERIIVLLLCLPLLLFAETDTIKFSFADWPPVISLDSTGNAQGIYGDIVHELFDKRLKIRSQAKELPWKRAQESVRHGKIDFIITVPTEERLSYAHASDSSFYDLYLHVFTWQGHPKQEEMKSITSAEDILRLNLTPVTNLGNGWHKNNIDRYGVKTHYVPAETNALSFLAYKRADITIEALVTMVHALKQSPKEMKIVDTGARFGPISMHLLLSKQSPFVPLLPKINMTFKEMLEDGTVDSILQKYHVMK